MKTIRHFAFMNLMLAVFVSSAALSAFADPPSRAVRLKYMSGAVSVQPGGVNDWVEAVVNRPLTTADRVWIDKDSRAELNLGSAALRLNAETSLTLTNVNDDIVQLELDQGTLNLHIRHLFGGETYEIDTPNQAFTILKAGDYRFDVDPNADTTSITVWKGEGEANGQGNGVRVRSKEQASFTGGTSLQHQISGAPGLDGFDDWCRVRDDREDHSESYHYVSADVVGADELDDYGTWRTTGEYGAVWVPRVAPGWAPYRYGHWVWVEPWGWTWVDDAPWGFAPCHYGRWIHIGGYWGWAPGPIVVERPIYAPALVAWVGGAHFGVSLSFGGGGGVGWFPLGWGEPYVPSYRVSRTYFQNVNVRNTRIVNITNVTNNYYVTNNNTTVVNQKNITNIRYANQNVTGAVTAVPTHVMVNSQSVGKAAVVVSASDVRTTTVAVAAPVAPVRTSLLGVRAGAPTAAPPARVVTARPVFSRAAPPPRPVPFEAKEEVLARNPGRPLDSQAEAQIRTKMEREAPPAPVRNANAPTQLGRPGAQPTPNLNATQPYPTPRPGGPQRPAITQPETAMPAPTRSVPRPPTPGMPASTANPVQPANAGRPVPRPPQIERTSAIESPRQPSRALDPERQQPSTSLPSEPGVHGAEPVHPVQPVRPVEPVQPARTDQPRRPEITPTPSAPNSEMPRPRSASIPRPVTQPSAVSAAPVSPRPPENHPRPQVESRQQSPRPPAESRPQHEQSRPQPKQSHQESKSEHKNESK